VYGFKTQSVDLTLFSLFIQVNFWQTTNSIRGRAQGIFSWGKKTGQSIRIRRRESRLEKTNIPPHDTRKMVLLVRYILTAD